MDPATDSLLADLDRAPVCVEVDGEIPGKPMRHPILIPGSFNPLHEGHWRLAKVAEELLGGPAAFELSVTNVDKLPLSGPEIRRRLAQFHQKAPVWLTRAPTFLEKAALFPGTVFGVGADTAARIVSARYYGTHEEEMTGALNEIRLRRCRFLVAGRVNDRGQFHGLEELAIPAGFRDLFQGIPEHLFRVDVSSTRLRQQKG